MAIPRTDPSRVGPYDLVRQLAAGGMGAVYAARLRGTNQNVAIKFIHSELAGDAEMNRRFRREATVLRAIQHPGVVRVIDVGADETGRCYTVMELLEGETLEARVGRGPLEVGQLVPILASLASALDAVHEHGIIHGDLKPANIFLTEQGAKLVDFGTSKVHGLERLTRTGEVSGTPTYMAPELLTGEGGIDERVDVYAMGVLAYRCLAGSTPFSERNPGRLLYQIVMGDVQPLDDKCPELPQEITAAVRKAMAPKRADRFGKASEFATALQNRGPDDV